MMLLKAAVASAAVIELSCDCGIPLSSRTLHFIAGRFGDVATLSAALKCGMPLSPHVCHGAARGGWLAKLQWLVLEQKCPVYSDISVSAAASGSIPVLTFLRELNISFTVDFTVETACSAAAAGHQHVIEYLHSVGCPFAGEVYMCAASNSHVHVLQRLLELQWPCNRAPLCKLAAERGLLQVLQWAKQQGAAFTEDTMVHAANNGHTAVCEYLPAQQCPCVAAVCTAAAQRCQLSTLRRLIEHGCPYGADVLWLVAADEGHIAILNYLQQIGLIPSPAVLRVLLLMAGINNRLAVAQWLRAHGAEWPGVLLYEVDGELLQWGGAVLERARAEGCTSPLH
jgi:hypothetical protein